MYGYYSIHLYKQVVTVYTIHQCNNNYCMINSIFCVILYYDSTVILYSVLYYCYSIISNLIEQTFPKAEQNLSKQKNVGEDPCPIIRRPIKLCVTVVHTPGHWYCTYNSTLHWNTRIPYCSRTVLYSLGLQVVEIFAT